MFRSPQPGDWASDDEFELHQSNSSIDEKPTKSAWGEQTIPKSDKIKLNEIQKDQANEQSTKDHQSMQDSRYQEHQSPYKRKDRDPRRGPKPTHHEERGYRDNHEDYHNHERNYRDHDRDHFDRYRDNDRGYRGQSKNKYHYDQRRMNSRRYGGDRYGGDRYGGHGDYDHESRSDRWERGYPTNGSSSPSKYGGRSMSSETRSIPIERGVVLSLKEQFGFVNCLDREGDLFFHHSEAPREIQIGDEVEFEVTPNRRNGNKLSATHLKILPKGTIVWEEIENERLVGIVTKNIPKFNSYYHSSSYRNQESGFGSIQIHDKPDHHVEKKEDVKASNDEGSCVGSKLKGMFISFNEDSLKSEEVSDGPKDESLREDESTEETKKKGKRLKFCHVGDEVSFRIAIHKKTGKKRAVNILILETSKEKRQKMIEEKLKDQEREEGQVIYSRSHGKLVIQCTTRRAYLPFRFEDVEDDADGNHVRVDEGDEVSFYSFPISSSSSVASPTRRHTSEEDLCAIKIQVLPKGSISFEDVLQTQIDGIVEKIPRETRVGKDLMGRIRFKVPIPLENESEEKPVENAMKESCENSISYKEQVLPFGLDDVNQGDEVEYRVGLGDRVQFDLVFEKISQRKRASNISMVEMNAALREQGIITSLKSDYGFIRCCQRPYDAYFQFCDVLRSKNSSLNLRESTEVSFDAIVETDQSKESCKAIRIQCLPKGTIQWEKVIETSVSGQIHQLPYKNSMSRESSRRSSKRSGTKETLGSITFQFSSPSLLDHFPKLKKEIDDMVAQSKKVQTFPSHLSRHERAAIHHWCHLSTHYDSHSTGVGPNRHLIVERVDEKDSSRPSNEPKQVLAEFSYDDVQDVRYKPETNEWIQCEIVLNLRTRCFHAKKIVIDEEKRQEQLVNQPKEEEKEKEGVGIITSVREMYGFITELNTNESIHFSMSLFQHDKKTLKKLKEGTEVEFSAKIHEKKKKWYAVNMVLLAKGSLGKEEVCEGRHRGIIIRECIESGRINGKFRHGKGMKMGTIRPITNDDTQNGIAESIQNDAKEVEQEEAAAEAEGDSIEGDDSNTSISTLSKPTGKSLSQMSVSFSLTEYKPSENGEDADGFHQKLFVGDEVEYTLVLDTLHRRRRIAKNIVLIKSNTEIGYVERMLSRTSGIICRSKPEKDAPSISVKEKLAKSRELNVQEIPETCNQHLYNAPLVQLRDDQIRFTHVRFKNEDLRQGDCVQFTVLTLKNNTIEAAGVRKYKMKKDKDSNMDAPTNSGVNKNLLNALRKCGATAVASSRMAKGPDGTGGFPEGWRHNGEEIEDKDLSEILQTACSMKESNNEDTQTDEKEE